MLSSSVVGPPGSSLCVPPRGTGNHGHLPRAATTTPSHHALYAPAACAGQETLLIAPAVFHFPSSLQSPRPASRRRDSRPDRSATRPFFYRRREGEAEEEELEEAEGGAGGSRQAATSATSCWRTTSNSCRDEVRFRPFLLTQ
jgi:hypothetical protein